MHGAPERARMTYEDLLKLPDDGLRHELIDGEHLVTPAPRLAHQIIVGNLYFIIATYVRERRCGVIFGAPVDVVLSREDVVEPDVTYFSNERYKEVATETSAQGAPDLAIEVLSPTTRRRDEVLKRRLYERMGVKEYWIVDPEIKTVKVHRLVAGRYDRIEIAREDDAVVTTALLPGLRVPLDRVFELP